MQSVTDKSSIETLIPAEYRFIPTQVFFLLNAILLFMIAFILTKHLLAGFAAFFIYTTAPSFVLSSRLAMLENTLIPLSLLTLLFLLLFKRYTTVKINLSYMSLALAAVTTGLSIATKESGIAVLIMSIAILVQYRISKKMLALFVFPSLAIGGVIYCYFFILSPGLAWNIFGNQTGRGFFGPLNFLYSMTQMRFNNFPLDGYWLFGFISVFVLHSDKEKRLELLSGFVATLVTYLFFAGLNYPWYSLPFIPFLVLASAIFVDDLIRKPQLLKGLIFFTLPLSSSFYWGFITRNDVNNSTLMYRGLLLTIILVILVSGWKHFFKHKNILMCMIAIPIGIIFVLWNIQAMSFIIEHWGSITHLAVGN